MGEFRISCCSTSDLKSLKFHLLFDMLTKKNSNNLLVQQAREDAQNMHKGSKVEKAKRHARKISAKFGPTGEGKHFEGGVH